MRYQELLATRSIESLANKTPKNFDLLGTDAAIFTDTYKGGRRLNILAHGGIEGGRGFIYINNRSTSAKELLNMLNVKNVDINHCLSYRVISCSAAYGDNSFVYELHMLTGKPVKGFTTPIRVLNEKQHVNLFNSYAKDLPDKITLVSYLQENVFNKPFLLAKQLYNYDRVKFG